MEPETSFLTLAEAESLGIEHDPPSRLACQYCGKEREPLGVKGPNGKVRWVTFAACGCAGEAEEEARRDKAEKAKREADAVKKLLRAGVPMRFIASEIRRPESLRFIESLGERTGRGLYLYGGVGAGKTSEASAIVKTVIRSGRKAILTTTLSMLNEISKGYGDSEGKDISHFIRTDLLVLDDVGKENANSWAATTVFEVVNGRYERMLPTIYTSQYSFPELEKRMSRSGERESAQAVLSRIVQTSTLVDLGHIDRRRSR